MTMTSTLGAGSAPSSLSRFRAVVRSRRRAYRAWQAKRANLRALRALSDHTLKDIGLHRSQLASVVVFDGADRTRRDRGLRRVFRLRSFF